MSLSLQFLGAAGTVTGSKFHLQTAQASVLVDCGLFQGYKQLRLRNWQDPPIEPATLDAIVLTHAHLDHSGQAPLWVRQGYQGPIYATPATMALCESLWIDSAHLQEEDAEYANRHGFSKHRPALPLYTARDAERALRQLRPVPWHEAQDLAPGVRATWQRAGHILGAASVLVETPGHKALFSGDLGRDDDPLMEAPEAPPACDTLVIESTYGDRDHPELDSIDELSDALQACVKHGSVAVVPVFAVGRAQMMMMLIGQLKAQGRLPSALPIYLDSPMAIDVTAMYQRFSREHRLTAEQFRTLTDRVHQCETPEASKAIARQHGPKVILAASGMATGGRVLHHLKLYLGSPRNVVVLTGHQVAGTRGDALAGGASHVRIHGEDIPVRARIVQLQTASAHADQRQLLAWAGRLPQPPSRTFIVHGEAGPADALRSALDHRLGWPNVAVPEHGQRVTLEPGAD